jgi:hypothetical protein
LVYRRWLGRWECDTRCGGVFVCVGWLGLGGGRRGAVLVELE